MPNGRPTSARRTRAWREVAERQRAELELLRSHDELEARVAQRTADLSRVNEGLAREVAEREHAEEAQRRMVAILDATTDFVVIADANKRVLYVNSAGQRMVGINQEDVSKSSISDYYSDSVNEIIAKEVLPTAIRDGVWSGEVAMLRREGHEIPVSMVAIAHKDGHGNVEFFSAIARDVTERNRADESNAPPGGDCRVFC